MKFFDILDGYVEIIDISKFKHMFKKLARLLLPNPLDRMLKKLARKKLNRPAHVLLAWNRGLGDIALGLYAMVQRIREFLPEPRITFLIRENLKDGFSLLEGVEAIVAPSWKRGEPYDVSETLLALQIDREQFDLIIERPNPTDWVRWQLGKVVPKLRWKEEYDALAERFHLKEGITYIGAQISAETTYGLWRNWPETKWRELADLLPADVKLIIFGVGKCELWEHPNVIDLRGQTTLFEMIALIKGKCQHLIGPDSGVLSMIYYLDSIFPMQIVSLWADPNHGILKQNVPSPNPLLVHVPLIAAHRDLSSLSAEIVYGSLFPHQRPCKPWTAVFKEESIVLKPSFSQVGCVILAGGQGTRLGFLGPKGMFPIHGKTLFERIIEKIPASTPIAIMTSPINHEETLQFLEKHAFFDKKISLFQQSTLPLLDEKKRPSGLEGADGNGSFYRSFVKSGLCDAWGLLGIHQVTITPVDNPLADPLDPGLLSFDSEVVVRCIERKPSDEMMGVLVDRQGRLEVLEYCEMGPELCNQDYLYAYTGLVSLRLSFIQRAALSDLPLHWVQKKNSHQGKSLLLWKGEKFLFDAFSRARSIALLCSRRETCYAPLKTKDGPNGIEAVEKALCR